MAATRDAKIVVTNDRIWYSNRRWGAMTIYVDGTRAGRAQPQGQAQVMALPGDHTVRVRQQWYRSPAVAVAVGSGERQTLRARRSFGFRGAARLLLHPSSSLILERT